MDLPSDALVASERSYPTPLAQSALLPLLLLSLARQKNSPDVAKKFRKEYDYIVVGAGASGSAVASRLSELPCVSVLLLEAGGAPPLLTEVPALSKSFLGTNIDWNFLTAPQKHTGYGLVNNQLSWPSGLALGGSTLLSSGFHVRGNRKDFDNWAAMGAKGWSYKEVLPFFKRLEDFRIPKYAGNGFHGVGGPVTVDVPRYESDITRALYHDIKTLGYPIIDPNGPRQTGFFQPEAHLRNSAKCSTAKAYLVPAENRKNFDILSNAFVRKVVINNGRATGVLFDIGGKKYTVGARREVVLSAGAINSAKILMLSGVGPKEELRKFNIPVHADLPVGRNFQDHGATSVDFILSPQVRPFSDKVEDPQSIKTYVENRTGVLSSTLGIISLANLLNDKVNPKVDFPNIFHHYLEGTFVESVGEKNLKPEVYEQVFGPYERETKVSCLVNTNRPRSRGAVTLQSADSYFPAVIDPNYFADPRDLDETVEGMKVCRRVFLGPAMRSLGIRQFRTLYPGCERHAGDEDASYRCQAQSVLYSLSHPVGTARMGDPRDPRTVLDPKLRVKGIRGLRVIDNSIMPTITTGNTRLPAIMIGEKGADLIKETIECDPKKDRHRGNEDHGDIGLYIYPLKPKRYNDDEITHDDDDEYGDYSERRIPHDDYDHDGHTMEFGGDGGFSDDDYDQPRKSYDTLGYDDDVPPGNFKKNMRYSGKSRPAKRSKRPVSVFDEYKMTL